MRGKLLNFYIVFMKFSLLLASCHVRDRGKGLNCVLRSMLSLLTTTICCRSCCENFYLSYTAKVSRSALVFIIKDYFLYFSIFYAEKKKSISKTFTFESLDFSLMSA